MSLPGALLVLFITGFWLYCLTDAMLTPPGECRGMPKRAWIVVIIVTYIGGAVAWLVVRPSARNSAPAPARVPYRDPDRPHGPLGPYGSPGPRRSLGPRGLRGWDYPRYLRDERWTDADDAVARHPAGRARAADAGTPAPKGPDDDLEFLRALDRFIRGNFQGGGDA